jgi:hypothetical protein
MLFAGAAHQQQATGQFDRLPSFYALTQAPTQPFSLPGTFFSPGWRILQPKRHLDQK